MHDFPERQGWRIKGYDGGALDRLSHCSGRAAGLRHDGGGLVPSRPPDPLPCRGLSALLPVARPWHVLAVASLAMASLGEVVGSAGR